MMQRIHGEAIRHKLGPLQPAPDLQICMSCFLVFGTDDSTCPSCHGSLISPYGLCQSGFSPVHTWCLGKRSEWKIRGRIDQEKRPIQARLPW